MNGTMRVLAVGDLAPECIARLEEDGLRVDARPEWGEAELAAGVDGYQALVAGPGAPVTAAVLAAGRALAVVGAGDGVAAIDVAAATRRGVVVVHAPDAGLVSEAEYALALVLACARDLAGADAAPARRARRGGSPRRRRRRGAGQDARPGRRRPSSPLLAERARALGMTVLACAAGDGRGRRASTSWTPGSVYAEADFLVTAGRARPGRAGATQDRRPRGRARGRRRRRTTRSPARSRTAVLAAAAVSRRAGRRRRPRCSPRRGVLLTSPAEASTADARRRAGVSVAEQVAAVLRGRLLHGAVNVPAASGDDADELMPYMGLCDRLGRLLVQLAGEPVDAVEITYGGSVAYYDTHLLTLGVLGGLLADRAGAPVNFVNAEVVAAELGVTATETRESGIPDFPRLITVAVAGTGGAMSVSGTSLGSEHKPRLVRVFGEDVDLAPAPHMAVLRYVDAPGIGGKVGTLLGEWGVNIGHMSVGRGKLGDEAVMVLTLDESLTREQTDALVARCGLAFARAVEL